MSSIIPSVFPIDNKLALSAPFIDWLSFTVPPESLEHLTQFLDSQFAFFGAARDDKNLYRFGTPEGYGTCVIEKTGQVYTISISGGAYRHFVRMQMQDDLLNAISEHPYKITRLDVACDFDVPAHLAVREIAQNAYDGNVRLTRKAITHKQIKEILTYDLDGNKTGTVYLGHRKSADVSAKIYDKGHEVYEKTGLFTVPRLRIEFTFKGLVMPTLRDVSLPSDIYFHHASHSLVKPPETFKGWLPHGTGFFVEKKAPKTAFDKLRAFYEFSAEIEKFCHLGIDVYGVQAPHHLAQMIKQRVKKSLRGMGFNPMQACFPDFDTK